MPIFCHYNYIYNGKLKQKVLAFQAEDQAYQIAEATVKFRLPCCCQDRG